MKYEPPKVRPLSREELEAEREAFMARRRDRSDELRRVRIPVEDERTKGGFPRRNRTQRGQA